MRLDLTRHLAEVLPALLTALSVGLLSCSTSQQTSPGADEPDGAAERGPWGEWVLIKAGTFKRGSPETEPGRLEIEKQHEVTLTTSFLMGATEVTQAQFEEVMGHNPSHFTECGPTCPVEDISWHEAAAYCNALSRREDLELCYSCTGEREATKCQRNAAYRSFYRCPGYRLASEAEWEYAARAGTTTSTYNGDLSEEQLECDSPNPVLDPIAWFCGNSGGTTHPVAQKEPNAFGLYDMLGNVWEWNHDWDRDYPEEAVADPWGPVVGLSRVGRGGSWVNKGRLVRAAARGGGTPDRGYGYLGLRVVKSSPQEGDGDSSSESGP